MVSISDIIQAFKLSYNSFEICSVIHNDGNVWNNVLTTIYISKNIIEKPEETILYDGTHIKILKIKTNYSDLISYLEGFRKGQLYLKGLQVQIASPFDYDNWKIDEDRYANYRQTEGARTFICQRNFNVFTNDKLLTKHLERINSDVIKLGFIDSFDFISHHTGLRGLRSFSVNHSSDFLMIIPIFFSINTVIVENEILTVDLVYDEMFNDLQINVIGYSEDHRNVLFRESMLVGADKNVNFNVHGLIPDSRLDVYLFSKRLPELQLNETIFVPINQPLIPFAETYNQFHKLEELERILTKPELLDRKNRSKLYENAVCDLFTLCGFSTILLRDHEILRLDNKTTIGSADILAYDGLENLFVIDCDIIVPDPKKMVNLFHLCRYLNNIPIVNKVKNIIPIIVSPSPPTNDDSEVIVIDGGILQKLLKGIHYKSKIELVSMITELYHLQQIKRTNSFFR